MTRKIHIENLQIRLKNGSPELARSVGNNLGNEILRRIADDESKPNVGTRRIEKLDGGTIKSENGAADLQSQIARRIATVIGDGNR